jgi:hypothetical protein
MESNQDPEDRRKVCCQQEENIYVAEQVDNLVIRKCKVCGCRHFELSVEAGQIGLTGARL